METVEGYRFRIDLDDRGMATGLTSLAKKARTLKSVMRANFNEAESMGNGFAALSGKVSDIQRAMDAYKQAISEAVNEQKKFHERQESGAKLTEDETKKLLNLTNKEAGYRNQLAKLNQQLAEAERRQSQYNEGLVRTRSVMAGMSASMSEYNRLLEQQGLKAYATKGRVNSLREAHELSQAQYKLEVGQTKSLQSALSGLQGKYTKNEATLQKLDRLRIQTSAQLNREKSSTNSNANSVDKLDRKYKNLTDNYNKIKEGQVSLRNSIINTTADMQKQTGATAKAATQMRKFKAELNSVHGGRFGGLARSISNVDAKLKASTSHTRAWANSLRGSLMTVGIGVGAFGAGIGKAVSMSANLQQSWVTTRNLLQTGAKNAAEARREVGRLGVMQRDAASYSKQYGYSQKEIADQYTELTKRGYTANQSIGSMKSMLQAARASGDDFNDVVKNVSSTVDAFGMRTNNTSKMIERTRRVTNAMAYAADMTATDFQGMGEAMSYVSASAHQAGQSVETTTAAIGELSNAGIEGTRAGTGMRKVMNSLIAPTSNATAALKKYGMSIDDFKNKDGSLKQLPDIMKIIESHTKNLGKADRGAFFKAVFGTTGQQAAMVLAQNADEMDKLVKKEKEAERSNYVQRLAKKNMASTKMQMKQLEMQVQAFAIQIGNTLLPAVNKVSLAISKWASTSAGKKSMKEFANSVKSAGNAIANNAGSILQFLGGFASGLVGVARVAGTAVSWIGKFFHLIHLDRGGSSIPKLLGEITGGLLGITVAVKALKTLFGGVSAIWQDSKSLFGLSKQTQEIKEQDSLYQRMIELQKESLDLSKRQAAQQGVNTEGLGKNTATQEAENIASDVPVSGKAGEAEKVGATATRELEKSGMEQAGARAGSKYVSGFLLKARGLGRGILGLILPTDFLNVGSKAGGYLIKGIGIGVKASGRVLGEAWRSFVKPIADIGPTLGRALINGMKNTMRKLGGSAFGRIGKEAALEFSRSIKGTAKSIGQFLSHDIIGETWVKAGSKAANLFKRGFSKIRISPKAVIKARFNPKALFKGIEPAAKEAGAKSGGKLVEGLGTVAKGSKLAGVGKAIAKGVADPFMVVFGAIDIMRAWNTSTHKNRAKNVGGAIGNLAGMAAGAKAGGALGATLGSVAPGIGNVVGGILGAVIGGIAGTKIGKILGPSLAKLWKGTVKTFDLLFQKHDWKGMMSNLGKSWKSFWRGMGNWWDEVIGKKTSKPSGSKSKSKSSSSSSKTFKSAGNVKYSKSDIANLKAMTKAIGSYKSSLKGLKSYVKNNDPSKQMNSMVSNMSKSVKGWDKLAKPIKKIGDAFKTLSKFASSMAKYDAFKALNNDLPKLETTLSKSKIGSKLKDISSQIKSSHIIGRMKDLTREIKSDTSKWKAFARPVKTVGAYMKDFAKAMDSMAGKGSSLQKFITLLPQMASVLDKNDIAGKLKKLGQGIKDSHVVGRLRDLTSELKSDMSKWKGFAKPVKTIGGYMKDFEKSVTGLTGKNAPLATLAQQIPTVTDAIKKNDLGGAVKDMASKIKSSGLGSALKSLTGSGKKKSGSLKSFASDISSLASSLKKINAQTKNYGGKNDHLAGMANSFKNLQTALKNNKIANYLSNIATKIKKSKINTMLSGMDKSVKNSAKNWKSLQKVMGTIAKSFKTLGNNVKSLTGKKSGFTQLGKDIKTFYNTVRKYPFGKQIASQARIANNAMSGKKTGFVQQFVRETNEMTKAVRSFGRAFNRDWKSSWKNLDSPVSRALRSVDSTVHSKLNDINDKRSDFSSSFLKGWNSWIDKVKSDFKSGFNKLPDYAESAMKSIVSKMNKGITGVNKVISDFGGDKKLSAISYANGTRGGHPGGHMLVNDSNRPHWKELVKFPGKAWRMFEGRNVLIPNAPKGTTVINGETTYALNSRGLLPKLGVSAYADGTDDGDEEADKIVKDPFGELKKIFFGATSFNGSAVVQDLGTAMSLGLIKGIQDVVKKMAEEADDNGAAATPAMIRKAATRMGIHDLTDSFVKLLMGVIMTESGNRSIKQSDAVHDVNSGVDPAAGILQYTNRTFMTYAMPGHTNRYKPYDELLAFFNNSDWRNSIGYPGYAHGKPDWLHTGPIGSPRMKHFANGGVVSMNQLINVAEGNRPEAIIPWDINKRPRALTLINQTLDHMEQDGGGTGNIHRSNSTSEKDDGFKDKVIALLANIAGFSAQQIQAIMSLNTGDDMKSRRARSQFYKNYGQDQRISDFQAF